MRKPKRRQILPLLIALVISLSYALALYSGIAWPSADGKKVEKDGSLTIDCSHTSRGYIMCRAKSSDKRYKLRIAKGDTTLTYDLNNNGDFEVFPLQLGSGKYKISLYKNKSGNKYSSGGEVKMSVTLDDENAAFLVPSQYVQYDEKTSVVSISDELCAGLTTDEEKFNAIRTWIKDTFLYDYVKAVTVQSGTLPDIEGAMETKMGICQDLAAIAACMLRVQGIPTQLAIGYRNRDYHAWNYVYLNGSYVLYDPTVEIGGVTKDAKYTLERYY